MENRNSHLLAITISQNPFITSLDFHELLLWALTSSLLKINSVEMYVFPLVVSAKAKVKLCPTLCDPMDCSLPHSSIHGIFQARVLEWIAISISSQPRDWTQVSRIVSRCFTIWVTGEVLLSAKDLTLSVFSFQFLITDYPKGMMLSGSQDTFIWHFLLWSALHPHPMWPQIPMGTVMGNLNLKF